MIRPPKVRSKDVWLWLYPDGTTYVSEHAPIIENGTHDDRVVGTARATITVIEGEFVEAPTWVWGVRG